MPGEYLIENLLLKLIESMQNSSDQTIKTIDGLSNVIRGLDDNNSKKNQDLLDVLRHVENHIKDQNHDISKIIEKIQDLMIISKSIYDQSCKTCTGTSCTPKLDAIVKRLEKIDSTHQKIEDAYIRLSSFDKSSEQVDSMTHSLINIGSISKNISSIKKTLFKMYFVYGISFLLVMTFIGLISYFGKISFIHP